MQTQTHTNNSRYLRVIKFADQPFYWMSKECNYSPLSENLNGGMWWVGLVSTEEKNIYKTFTSGQHEKLNLPCDYRQTIDPQQSSD